MISSELIREELAREYGVKVKGRIDWYVASCGHIVAVVGQKSYHLDLKPTILSL